MLTLKEKMQKRRKLIHKTLFNVGLYYNNTDGQWNQKEKFLRGKFVNELVDNFHWQNRNSKGSNVYLTHDEARMILAVLIYQGYVVQSSYDFETHCFVTDKFIKEYKG